MKWPLTVLSAVLAVIWLASFGWWLDYAGNRLALGVDFGRLGLAWEPQGIIVPTGWTVLWNGHSPYTSAQALSDWSWEELWNVEIRRDNTLNGPGISLFAPFWSVVAVSGFPVILLWRAERGDRRIRRGLCASCGYELRGLPGTSPCPECGRYPSLREVVISQGCRGSSRETEVIPL
jgi:hypothetical protein